MESKSTAHKIKRRFAKEWLIILALSLLTMPVAGILYGVQKGMHRYQTHNVQIMTQRAEGALKRVEAEWQVRRAQREQAFDPAAYLKKYGRPAADEGKILDLLEQASTGIFSDEQQAVLDKLESQAFLGKFTDEEVKALKENIKLDGKELVPSLEGTQDFTKTSTVNLFHIRKNLNDYIAELQNAANPRDIDYWSLVALGLFFVLPVWFATIFIRVTIWSLRTVRMKELS